MTKEQEKKKEETKVEKVFIRSSLRTSDSDSCVIYQLMSVQPDHLTTILYDMILLYLAAPSVLADNKSR